MNVVAELAVSLRCMENECDTEVNDGLRVLMGPKI